MLSEVFLPLVVLSLSFVLNKELSVADGSLTVVGIPNPVRTAGTFSSNICPSEKNEDVSQYMNNAYKKEITLCRDIMEMNHPVTIIRLLLLLDCYYY